MAVAIYPGSFDPVTRGHLDIIIRASKLFDHLIVSVLNNSEKTPLFSVEERVKMLEEVCRELPNVTVDSFSGLTVDYAKQVKANTIVRGLRAVTDFEYELQLAQLNRTMLPDLDTIFLTTSLEYAYLSSSVVREIAAYGGDISKFVPDQFMDAIYLKAGEKNRNGKQD